jgi:hypothetical protein
LLSARNVLKCGIRAARFYNRLRRWFGLLVRRARRLTPATAAPAARPAWLGAFYWCCFVCRPLFVWRHCWPQIARLLMKSKAKQEF